jgi:uncharacterized membrane protein YeaQ/YmgE (transglycosylase-associated protein family)
METLNNFAASLGVDLIMAGIWLGAGFVLGLIMVGRRPLGLFGDLVIGLIGGGASGYLFHRFGGTTIDAGQYVSMLAPSLDDANPNYPAYIGAFAEAFVGALVLLVLVRLFIRR